MTPFDWLRAQRLPDGHYAIFGSGPLIVRGIVPFENDLDVLCRGPAWRRALQLGDLIQLPDHDVKVVSACDGTVQFGREWAIGDVDVDAVIDGAESIEGLPFAQLSHVAAYKRLADRPKDRAHLAALQAYLRKP